MSTPFAAVRAITTRPLTWRTWLGLVTVPLLVMGLLTWAFWAPGANHHTAQAAVVNNDEPVTVNGQTIPLGRQLAGDLTHDADSAYTWVLTDADDATAGLADGSYAAVVTIPSSFSAQATSAASGKPLDAIRGMLTVDTTAAAGTTDPTLSEQVAADAQQSLNHLIVTTYLDNIYVGFNTVHDSLQQAADGATQLADGTAQLKTGAHQLADGTTQLKTGAHQVADGTEQLADGTTQLADGSTQLSDGLTQAVQQTAALPSATRQLADGADQVADGNEQLSAQVVPLVNSAITILDALPAAADAAAEVQRAAAECASSGADPTFCDTLTRAADRSDGDAQRIDSAKTELRSTVVQARDSVQALAVGARQVATGTAQLADNASELATGIADAATGARQLDTGIQQADTAAHQLASGSAQVATGADQSATGAKQLSDGLDTADDGTHTLATQLTDGVGQVPTYTDDERTHLADIAADPTRAAVDRVPFGTLAITLFGPLALWVLALITYVVTRPLPRSVLTSRQPTWRIVLAAAGPGATAAATAAVVISLIAVPVLNLRATTAVGFLLAALLMSFTFVALNQALAAIFGAAGRLASIAVAVLAVATGIVSTLPGPLHALTDWLPTRGAVLALRAVATGGPGLVTGVVQVAAWLIVGTLATILVTDRRRYLSPRRLRLDAPLDRRAPVSTVLEAPR